MAGIISFLPKVLSFLGKVPKEVYAVAGAIVLFFFYGNMREQDGYDNAHLEFQLSVATAPAETTFVRDTVQLPPVVRWREPEPGQTVEPSAQELALINELILEADDLKDLVAAAYAPFELVDTVSTQARTMDGTWFKLEFFESLRAQPLDKTIPRSFEFKPIYLRTIGVQTKKIIVGGTSWWKYAGAGLVGVAVGVAVTK